MPKLYNLARMTTTTTGAGNITLGSAVSGFLSFGVAGLADGERFSYAIQDGAASEIGTSVYTASGTTMTREVDRSTNANAAIILSGSAQVIITARAEDIAPPTALQIAGRLSLTSGVAIPESDVVGATIIYLVVAAVGTDCTAIYDGKAFNARRFTADLTLTLDTTGHLSGKIYDVFEYWDGTSIKIGTGPTWSSSTQGASARGTGAGTTELETFGGYPVNKNAIVLRNNSVNTSSIPARQATYRGSFLCNANGLTSDGGSSRTLYNQWNPTIRPIIAAPTTTTINYTATTPAQTGQYPSPVILMGMTGRMTEISHFAVANNGASDAFGSSGARPVCGIGINNATNVAQQYGFQLFRSVSDVCYPQAKWCGFTGLGYNAIFPLIWTSVAVGTVTWNGNNGAGSFQPGLIGSTLI